MTDIDTAEIRRCLEAGMSPMAGHGQLVPDLLDEVDRLRARLAEVEAERSEIEEVRRLRRDLNDERVRNQHDRDLARELSRRLAEVEIHNDLAEDELEVELDAKRELIVERDALADEATLLRARLAEVEAERDAMTDQARLYMDKWLAAEDKLRAVEVEVRNAVMHSERIGLPDRIIDIVRGEGDRPAEHHDTEDAHGNPICVCPDLRGEGDRG